MSAVEPIDNDAALKAPEAAKLLGIHVKSLYKLVDAGQVPYVRLSPRRLRFRRSSLVAFMASRERAPGKKNP